MREPISAAIDLVLVITLFECIALIAYNRLTGRGLAPRDFLLNAAAGLCLMLALRAFADQSGTTAVLLLLMAAGVAHATDIALRWRRNAKGALWQSSH